MDELTMLVQLAGGEVGAVRRLRASGAHEAADLARADPDDLQARSGLSRAVARRLIRAANELVVRPEGRAGRSLGGVLQAFAAPSASAAGRPVRARKAAGEPPKTRAGRGVSKEESSALAGEDARAEPASHSFWRFG